MRTLVGFVGVAVLSVLVACGGEEREAPPPPAAPPSTTAPAAATPPSTTKKGAEPLAIFLDANTIEGKAPLTVTFDVDLDGGKEPYTWKWDFGDGQKSTEANPKLSHVYEKPGTYMVEVTVNDSGGDSDFDILEIEVK